MQIQSRTVQAIEKMKIYSVNMIAGSSDMRCSSATGPLIKQHRFAIYSIQDN